MMLANDKDGNKQSQSGGRKGDKETYLRKDNQFTNQLMGTDKVKMESEEFQPETT